MRGGAGLQSTIILLLLAAPYLPNPASAQIEFTTPPSDVVVAQGSPARFDCAITSPNAVSISWRKDGNVLTPSAKFSFLPNSSLVIDPTEAGDEGTYSCVVTDLTTGSSEERGATLTFAQFLDSFVSSPESQTADEGDFLLFFCIHGGSVPPATITWTYNDDIIITSSRITIQISVLGHTDPLQVSSSLAIGSVEAGDAGRYRCIATNPFFSGSEAASEEAVLSVRALPEPPSILQSPSNITVAPGSTASFTCQADGEPPPTITWTHNGNPLVPSSQISIQTSAGVSTLAISGVQTESEGSYQCEATNSEGAATSNTAQLLTARIDSSFQLQPTDTVALLGSSTLLHCLPPPSTPPAVVTWTKNFAQLTGMRFQILENGSLEISNLELGDQGTYHCTATNELLGISRTSIGAQLSVLGVPVISPPTASVSIGQSVSFSCEAQGDPPPQITWLRGTNQIVSTPPKLVLTDNTLTVAGVTLDDEGYYTCRAEFLAGTTEARVLLDVLSSPLFQNENISLTVFAGDPITLPCAVHPDPTLSFLWLYEGVPLDLSTEGVELLPDGSLSIAAVVLSQAGGYTCVASNTLGTAQGNVALTVLVPTTISAVPASVTVIEGQTAVLSCVATGDPTPVLSWFQNGTEVPNPGTPRYQLAPNGAVLTIEGARDEDEGEYQCQATNPGGSDQDTVTLSVYNAPVVEAMPITQQLVAGSTAMFTCTATGDPAPQIRWLDSSAIDVTTLGDTRIQVHPNGSLTIVDVAAGDQQQYICEGSNVVGSQVTPVSLTVLVAPTVTLTPSTTVTQGNPLTLDCQQEGNPPPTLSWFKDGEEIQLSNQIAIDGSGRLVISSVVTSDAGTYTCRASNSIGSDSADTVLTVLVFPVIQLTVTTVVANESSQAVLDCVATGNPPPVITWFRGSVPLPSPTLPHVSLLSNGSLLFSGVREEDGGEYLCRASNTAGTESATVQLIVQVAPSVLALESTITTVEGNDVTLTCVAMGDPAPVLSWFRNGIQVPNPGTPRYMLLSNGSMLVILSVLEAEDEGPFQCFGTNPAGMDQDTITLTVLVPPQFTSIPTNSTTIEGAQHTLTCSAEGDPTPLISWSRDGVLLSSQGTLVFPATSRGDAGLYTCTATNSAASVSMDVFLDVQYAPSIVQPPTSISVPLNNDAQFTCIADGNPQPEITWLFGGAAISGAGGPTLVVAMVTGEDAGQYTCMVSNAIGETSVSATLTVLFPPSAPTNLVAMATSSTSISVQWDASANNGGSPITGYVVEYRVSSSSTPFTLRPLASSVVSTLLSDLAPHTSYEIRVRAENVVGASDPSTTVQEQTHPDVPVAPGDFRVTSSTSSTLSLSWDQPDPLNGVLAAYELQYGREDDFIADVRTRLLFVTQFTVSGIEQDAIYRLRVRASTISLTGESLWGPFAELRVLNGVELEIPTEEPSPSPTPSQPPSSVPPPPTTTSSEMDSPTQSPTTQPTTISLATTTSPSVAQSSSILLPIVPTSTPTQATTSTPVFSSQTQPTRSSTPAPVIEPTPTIPPTGLAPPTVAPAAVMVYILSGSIGEIFVYWREPTSGLDTFDGYQIFISPAPPPSVTTPIFAPKTSISGSYIIQGLANFTLYTVTVATYNEGGVGPLTAMDSIMTPETEPSAPRDVIVATIPMATIFVSWLGPDPPNGIILDYRVEVRIDHSGELFESRTVTVEEDQQGLDAVFSAEFTGLQLGGVRYQVTVSARTSVGRGPESEPEFVGTQAPQTPEPSSTSQEPTQPPTTEQQTTPTPTFTPPTQPPTTEQQTTPTPTFTPPTQPPTTTPTPTPSSSPLTSELPTLRDSEGRSESYYIIRIVPPVVLAVALVFLVVMAIMFYVHLIVVAQKRKRQYKFSELENDGDTEMRNRPSREGEPVAYDDLEPSAYYVKDALDANFTFAPGTTGTNGEGSEGSSAGEEPDIGTALEEEGEEEGEGRRDALQESPSGAESGAPRPHPPDNQSVEILESQRPVFQPGDYTYAELDIIRASKARERAKRFGLTQGPLETMETADTREGDSELSFGGIKETRIGAVGIARDGGQSLLGEISPEASAHMY